MTPNIVNEELSALRLALIEGVRTAGKRRQEIYHTAREITTEYSLLSHLSDILSTASMITHTIDSVRLDAKVVADAELVADDIRAAQWRRQAGTFLESTS